MLLPRLLRDARHGVASVKTTWWLAGCAIITTSFVALCLGALLALQHDAVRRAEAAASQAAASAGAQVAALIDSYNRALQATVEHLHSPTVEALEEPVRSLVMFDRMSNLEHRGFVNVLDERGKVVESPEPYERGLRWSGRDYFRTLRTNPTLTFFIGRPFGQADLPSIPIARRWTGPDGGFAGIVVASLHLDAIREIFNRVEPGANGSMTLLRSDGVVLMGWPYDRDDIGRSMREPQEIAGQRVVQRQIGELPLALRVAVAPADLAGAVPQWILAVLAAGMATAAVSFAVLFTLRRESHRRHAAERSNRQTGDYLAMITRELQAPLHSICENTDRLCQVAPIGQPGMAHASAILTAVNHLQLTIDRALNNLQVAWRVPAPHMRQVNLTVLLDRCALVLESEIAARGLILHYGFKAGAPELFATDEELLRQILINLLSNAAKFTERGSIAIEVGGGPDCLTIEVADTGCGISAGLRHKLFRCGEPLGDGTSGHGIGLAMAQRLVQALGGNIGHRDNLAGGSIFWISLPAGAVSETVPHAGQARTAREASMLPQLVSGMR